MDHYESDDEEPPPLQPRNEDYGSSSEGEESDDKVEDVPNLNPRRSATQQKNSSLILVKPLFKNTPGIQNQLIYH